jgi:2-keto-4-pentenoate hydratase/2-oxohepta-3-ene-1,7-dioic acid hydratase in catechol pathway
VDSSISHDSDSVTADAPTSKAAGSVLKQLVLATATQSSYSLYGSHEADGAAFTAQQLQEWPVQDCKDYVVRWVLACLDTSRRQQQQQQQQQWVLAMSHVQQLLACTGTGWTCWLSSMRVIW